MNNYWFDKYIKDLGKAKTFKDIGNIALRVLNRFPGYACQVCGPVSTGGLGSRDKNI